MRNLYTRIKHLPIRQKMIILTLLLPIVISICLITLFLIKIGESQNLPKQIIAEKTGSTVLDKIDRNYFERCGDVQAFAFNQLSPKLIEQNQSPEIKDEMQTFINKMVELYTYYDVVSIIDTTGKPIICNTISYKGRMIDYSPFLQKNFQQTEWFKHYKSYPNLEFYYSDYKRDSLIASIYHTRGEGLEFIAPIYNAKKNVIGYWYNFTNWDRTGHHIIHTNIEELKRTKTKNAIVLLTQGDLIIEAPYKKLLDKEHHLSINQFLETRQLKVGKSTIDFSDYELAVSKSNGENSYKGNKWKAITLIKRKEFDFTDLISKDLISLTITTVISLIALLFLVQLNTQEVVSKIKRIIHVLNEMKSGLVTKLNLPDRNDKDELSLLMNTINEVIEFNEQENDRKRTEITDLFAYQKSILDSTKQSIISTNLEGIILNFNKGAEEMLGYEADEVIKKLSPAIFHDLDEVVARAKTFSAELGTLIEPGFGVFTCKAIKNGSDTNQWTYIKKNGDRIQVELTATPIYNSNNEIVGYTGVATDITEISRINKEIIHLNEALNESSIVTKTDQNGIITYVNNKFEEISGYNANETLGKTHQLINSGYHSPTFFKELWETINKGEIWRGEICNKNKSGENYWVATSIIPIVDKNNAPIEFISIRQDITQRKKYEHEILQAKLNAEELAEIKANFLSSMSHEIRTPLNGILGFTQLLLKDKELNTIQKKQLDAIKTSGDILLVIINDILDISKMEAGKMTIERVPVVLKRICEQVVDTFSVKIESKKLNVKIEFDPSITFKVKSDPVRLSQILLNLISNAIKFTAENGYIQLIVKLLETKDNIATIQFKVIDSGIGINEEKLKTVFDAFTQTSDDTARKFGGTGLGLTIVKKIVELKGGVIEVESKIEQGTTFSVTIPFEVENSEHQLESNSEDIPTNFESEIDQIKILLAEDNAINQLLAQTVLTQFGYAVHIVDNGKKALDIVQQETFDIILMDLMMPEMDGYEATKAIRSLENPIISSIPIIAVTADVTNDVINTCKQIQINDYISKPFDPQDLKAKIERLVK